MPQRYLTSPEIDVDRSGDPVWTHFELAKKALENGKHVFVEKPFTSTAHQAEQLFELAAKKNSDHGGPHVPFQRRRRKDPELVDNKTLGSLYYFDSTRVNLGTLPARRQRRVGPGATRPLHHGLHPPREARSGRGNRRQPRERPRGHGVHHGVLSREPRSRHVNVNWLSPVKVRTTLIGGKDKMLVWNDLEPDEKIKVYDKGVDIASAAGRLRPAVSYRSGDVWAPKVEQTEALKLELGYFVECIRKGARSPVNDGAAGLRVVKLLEAAEQSLNSRGRAIRSDAF
jgi:predicted dehydrogenase